MLSLIAFDADDTLWHNETLYMGVEERFATLVAPYASSEQASEVLHQVEVRNLKYYGYGIKGYTISLIEAAIQLSGGKITGTSIQSLIDITRDMLVAHVQLIDHAEEVVTLLSGSYELMIITKGDLFEQQAKIARSGLRDRFRHVEIVSDKTPETYATLLTKYNVPPSGFVMIGNSLRSDILPVLELGSNAVYVPYHATWAHEHAEPPHKDHAGFYELEHIGQLPALLDQVAH
jgi:putative hydrolase of the HAD superfamily